MDFEIVKTKILIFQLVRASKIKNRFASKFFCASKRHMCTVILYRRLLCICQCILLSSYLMFGALAAIEVMVRG